MTLGEVLSREAAKAPAAPAVLFDGSRWTYAELERGVQAVAAWLTQHGVIPGDRVAMLSPPRPEFWFVMLACGSVGAIWTGLDPRYRPSERAARLHDADPRIVIAVLHEGDTLDGLVGDAGWPVVRLDADAPPEANLELLKPTQGCSAPPSAALPDDPAILVYTSGSTGAPKGALISHFGLVAGSDLQACHLAVERPSIICNLPINHVGAVADVCCTTLVRGGCIVFQPRFDAAGMLAAVAKHRISIVGGVPTMFLALLEDPDFATADLSSVELVLWGGASMPIAAVMALADRFPRLKAAYGMTETSCHVAFTPDSADPARMSDSVGRIDPRVEARIVDEDGIPLENGQAGELQIRAATNFLGYFRNAEATRTAFTADGWLRTGDVAWRDTDGFLRLSGRMSEMFKSGGYNVHPREVEAALERHPAVSAAAVIGVPDPRFQEVGAAAVILAGGAAVDVSALRSHLRDELADYKVPKTIDLRDALPMLPIGKIDRQALKAQFIREGNLA